MENKTVKAVIANLTFTVGQLEEIKSNINDTMRYIKNNTEWDTKTRRIQKTSQKRTQT